MYASVFVRACSLSVLHTRGRDGPTSHIGGAVEQPGSCRVRCIRGSFRQEPQHFCWLSHELRFCWQGHLPSPEALSEASTSQAGARSTGDAWVPPNMPPVLAPEPTSSSSSSAAELNIPPHSRNDCQRSGHEEGADSQDEGANHHFGMSSSISVSDGSAVGCRNTFCCFCFALWFWIWR